MLLTSQTQLQTLKTNLAANANTILINGVAVAISAVPRGAQNAQSVEDQWYNVLANPVFTLWRKKVPLAEIATRLNGTELAGLSTLNHTRLQTVITLISASGGMDSSVADMRQFFDDIFSGTGGTITRPALLALWKGTANNVEKLFAVGTGSNASPATSVFSNGAILTGDDVTGAWAA